MPSNEEKIKSLISSGSEITGAAAGGVIGSALGGPVGGAIGGASGVIISKVLTDFVNRILSSREKVRVGATAYYAITKINSRLDAGDKLRNDGFFEVKEGKRADAEEIFEGVLLKAKNEHEEKKTRILGNIFTNIAFYPSITIGQANHALKIAESLTYRQMCLLSLITLTEGIELNDENLGRRKKIPYETMSLLQEMYQLSELGLITPKDPEVVLVPSWRQMVPKHFELSPLGEKYYQLMGIEESIPDEDVRDVARPFQLDPA